MAIILRKKRQKPGGSAALGDVFGASGESFERRLRGECFLRARIKYQISPVGEAPVELHYHVLLHDADVYVKASALQIAEEDVFHNVGFFLLPESQAGVADSHVGKVVF